MRRHLVVIGHLFTQHILPFLSRSLEEWTATCDAARRQVDYRRPFLEQPYLHDVSNVEYGQARVNFISVLRVQQRGILSVLGQMLRTLRMVRRFSASCTTLQLPALALPQHLLLLASVRNMARQLPEQLRRAHIARHRYLATGRRIPFCFAGRRLEIKDTQRKQNHEVAVPQCHTWRRMGWRQ